jgi:L-fuconolactonase
VTIDAHVHVWDPAAVRIPWLDDQESLGAPHLPASIDHAGSTITEWIFVECDPHPEDAVREVQWVLSQPWPNLRAVVAHVDLTDQHLEDRLQAFRNFPLVKGVRQVLQQYPLDYIGSDELRRSLSTIASAGFTFDACVRWYQLGALVKNVEAVVNLDVVIDHLGKPPVDHGLTSDEGREWARSMRLLSRIPQVMVKLSGLPAEASSHEVLAQNGPDFLREVLELFGPDRCMFGTDWPVSRASSSGVTSEAWREMVESVTPIADRSTVTEASARQFYRLDGIR